MHFRRIRWRVRRVWLRRLIFILSCFANSERILILFCFAADFNVYIWKLPPIGSSTGPESPHFVLKSHRSVVNSVRYNKATGLLASCGFEKMVKIWSVVPLPNSTGGLDSSAALRIHKPRVACLHPLALAAVFARLSSRDEIDSTEEDGDMLAFMDMLLMQRPGSSDDDDDDGIRHIVVRIVVRGDRLLDRLNSSDEDEPME